MLSVSSFKAASSKMRRGLVVGSVRSASGRVRYLAQPANQVNFDLSHLFYRRLRPPIPLAEREITVANEPPEGSRATFENQAAYQILPRTFRDFRPQRVTRLGLRHVGFEVERNAYQFRLFLVGNGIDDAFAEIAIPAFSAQHHHPAWCDLPIDFSISVGESSGHFHFTGAYDVK